MSAAILQDLNSLNLDNIIQQPNIIGRSETILTQTPMMGYARFRMDYEAGIFYLGTQRFSLAHWAYPFLPKWMQVQGRPAKESFSIFNNALWEIFEEGDLKFHVRRVCDECSGPLRMGNDGSYYCNECGLVVGSSIMLPGYDSIRQSTIMADHNYNDPIL